MILKSTLLRCWSFCSSSHTTLTISCGLLILCKLSVNISEALSQEFNLSRRQYLYSLSVECFDVLEHHFVFCLLLFDFFRFQFLELEENNTNYNNKFKTTTSCTCTVVQRARLASHGVVSNWVTRLTRALFNFALLSSFVGQNNWRYYLN